MKSLNLPKFLRLSLVSRVVLFFFLLILVGIGAVPGYLSGNWSWAEPPPVTNLKQLKELRQTGLALPELQTLEQQTVTLGGHKWSFQAIKTENPKPVLLLLLPQNGPKSQPQVEWVDIDGFMKQRFGQWKTDSYQKIRFSASSTVISEATAKVEARFFRAWHQQQTFAILQWYAWPEGGHPAASNWFWADQIAQLKRQRVPWVAVCLQIPIEPLGDIDAYRQEAQSLARMVQTALMKNPLVKS